MTLRRHSLRLRAALGALGVAIVLTSGATPNAQQGTVQLIPGRNVNMVSGTSWPDGDPYLQRQNEPSVAASTRNPLHLLAGANDYRTVDIPFVNGADETGDAWLGIFKSFDGGQRWKTTLLPGYPQDMSQEGLASPLRTHNGGYSAGADPVVRAGTNGLLYYNGLVFDRTATGNGKSAVFLARFIDNNNREAGDPIKYLGTSLVAASGPEAFLDKPWMVVDIPRGRAGSCRIETTETDPKTNETRNVVQTVPAGVVYVAYTAFTTDAQGERADIYLTSSTNCGVSFGPSIRVNDPVDRLNQGTTMAVDPKSGDVYLAWRKFAGSATGATDGLMAARYNSSSRKLLPPGLVRKLPATKAANLIERIREKRSVDNPSSAGDLDRFDQATTDINSSISFRTNAYPTLAIDGSGRIYMAWAERGFGAARGNPTDGDARIVMATSGNGSNWSAPRAVADERDALGVPIPGHQFMPSLTVGNGGLVLVYYDMREDKSQVFSPFADDRTAIDASAPKSRRTLDLRASRAAFAASPIFQPSVRVSDYLTKDVLLPDGSVGQQQLQFNPPNLPMFKLGTAPFIGDYIDVATAPAFVPAGSGRWAFNTDGQAVFHAVWTDNRDVRQPGADVNGDGNPWNDYTAPTQRAGDPTQRSVFDGSTVLPSCTPANSGSRNQNIYTARLTMGLIVGSPGNSKPLSPTLKRAFSVFAQNTTAQTKTFRMTIANQPPGGKASFDQLATQALLSVDVTTPARSMAARTVYVTSTQPDAQVSVTVREIAGVGGGVVSGGLSDVIILNPDISNPDISNPDISNPDISNPDISNAEVYNPDISNPDISNPDISNPDISNPDISNPDISNPDISNPDISNPDISNVQVANPDISNPDISNPDISNPDISNPDISNPDISNPDISNTGLTDVTWEISNTGNTAASYNVNLFLAQATNKICTSGQTPSDDGCIATQLIMHKAYSTPTTTACVLQVQTQNVLIANIPRPRFVTPGQEATQPNDPSANNATLWLGPGETARITLRIADPKASDNTTVGGGTIDEVFVPTTSGEGGLLTPFVTQQAVNTQDVGSSGQIVRYPASVFFLQQPTTAPLGFAITPAVTVQVRDQLGAALPNAVVNMTLVANAAGGNLSDVPPPNAVAPAATTDASGTATFPTLFVDRAGTGYQLEASVIDATTTTSISNRSVTFNVPLQVTNTSDSGPGSLRYAIERANATAGIRETVVFAIPGSGPFTIAPATALPAITDPLLIDGLTQPGAARSLPQVIVDGNNIPRGEGEIASPPQTGFAVQAADVTIRALGVQRFSGDGIDVAGVANVVVDGNRISGNGGRGVDLVNATNARLVSNIIGLAADGTIFGNATGGVNVTSSAGAVIGDVGVGNVISGNNQVGIELNGAVPEAPVPVIRSNRIGTDPSGQVARGNTDDGLLLGGAVIVGGAAPGQGNLISGNASDGVYVRGNGVQIIGNLIGTNASNTGVIGNGGVGTTFNTGIVVDGFYLDGELSGTIISNNTIAGSVGAGIGTLNGAINTRISGNSISSNGGLGIDLGLNGITANDNDDDGDGYQNWPAITRAVRLPSNTTVTFDFDSASTQEYTLEFFVNASCDPSGHGEGGRRVISMLVTTDESGFASGSVELPEIIPVGQVITATATSPDGNTSEFSACRTVEEPPAFTIASASPATGAPGEGFMVLRGSNFPAPGTATAEVRNATTTANGFIFLSPSTTSAYWVRLPAGFPSGPATIQIKTPSAVSNEFPITVSTTPGTPVITAITAPLGTTTTQVGASGTIYIHADGIDTLGAVVRFQQGTGTPVDVAAGTAHSSPAIGLAVEIIAPSSLTAGNVSVSIRQGTSAYSTPVTLTVPAPPGPAAETTTTFAGGSGGSDFGPYYCGGGGSAIGIRVAKTGAPNEAFGNIDYALTSASMICSNGTDTTKFGGGTTPNLALACGAGEVMVGFYGYQTQPFATPTAVVGSVAPRCRNLSTGAIRDAGPPQPGSGGTAFGPYDCAAGKRVIGVVGRQGAVVDQMALVCAPMPTPSGPVVLMPYLSTAYKYQVVTQGATSDFHLATFDDSSFATGNAGFGSADGQCTLNATSVNTAWALGTDILLRRNFNLSTIPQSLQVAVAVDNDVQVFINGTPLSTGLIQSEGCATPGNVTFAVPINLLQPGANLIAVRARDRGGLSYVDVQVTAVYP